MKKKCIVSSSIYMQEKIFAGGMVFGDTIENFVPFEEIDNRYEVIDYMDNLILPGVIEMHTHGYLGWSVYTTEAENICQLSKALASVGITAYMPTTQLYDEVLDNLAAIAEAQEGQHEGARILGIHMQGPFISPQMLGSVAAESCCEVNIALMQRFIDASHGNVKTVTLAPEIPNIDELLDFLNKEHINISLGHSVATYAETMHAIDKGAVISQKTGNCMAGIHHRDMHILGACLLDNRLYNEITSDCHHLCPEFMELAYRLKGNGKICIVSDSSFLAGLPLGVYSTKVGTMKVCVDHMLRNEAGVIAGSAANAFIGMKNWVNLLGKTISEAIQMASLNPARVLGIDDRKGSLEIGKDADFLVVDKLLNLRSTYIAGSCEYNCCTSSVAPCQSVLNCRISPA